MQQIGELAKDKAFLLAIIDNNYELPEDIDANAFAHALLPNFGSTDSELRDDLSYMVLARGIIDKQKLDPQQLEDLLNIVMDEQHLFYRIGEFNTNSIFMRSFSNLIIAAILFNDARKPAFDSALVQRTKLTLLHYAQKERDWRGYIEGKGWAHALAHLADALDECAQHPHMGESDRKEILAEVCKLAILPEAFYNEEDVRLAKIPYHIILGHQVNDEFLNAWLHTCTYTRDGDVIAWTRVTNVKNFLRSLYFLLHWDNVASVFNEQIAEQLKKLDDIYLEKREGE
jgi:hypothetical protein